MQPKRLLTLALLLPVFLFAQEKPSKQIVPFYTNSHIQYFPRPGQGLQQTHFSSKVKVTAGQKIYITSSIEGEKTNLSKNIFKRVARAVGVGAILFQSNRMRNSKIEDNNSPYIPAIGMGASIPLPVKSKRAPLENGMFSIDFFNEKGKFLGSHFIREGKKMRPYTVDQDGYVKISRMGNPDHYLSRLRVEALVTGNIPYSGGIAGRMQLESEVDCLDPVYHEPCDEPDREFTCECNTIYCHEPDPCEENPLSCECNPMNCPPPSPCETNPNSCDCNPAFCGSGGDPDPGGGDPDPVPCYFDQDVLTNRTISNGYIYETWCTVRFTCGGMEVGRSCYTTSMPDPGRKTIKDQTITDNLMANCVVDNLAGVISSVLGNQPSTSFTIKLEAINAAGRTSTPGTPGDPYLIRVNPDQPASSSGLVMASTVIHEVYHVMLADKMMSGMGNYDIDTWTSKPADPILGELYDNYHYRKDVDNMSIADAKKWAQHDWLAHNLDQLATSLKDYVATYYPSTYADMGSSLDPYMSFFYISDGEIGVNNSRFGGEILSKLGGDQSAINSYYGRLFTNTHGCSN